MLARKTAVFKPCNGQHQRSENPNATPGHSQIFRKITVMVLSGQKWHRNREKTDIYIYLYIIISIGSIIAVAHQKSIKSSLVVFGSQSKLICMYLQGVYYIHQRGLSSGISPISSSLLVCRPPFSEYLVQRLSE